jgi:hypothetical protein
MHQTNTEREGHLREQLEREILGRRRDFLKRALLTCAYAAPVAVSFAAQDLARAASCPGVGNCGSSEWALGM